MYRTTTRSPVLIASRFFSFRASRLKVWPFGPLIVTRRLVRSTETISPCVVRTVSKWSSSVGEPAGSASAGCAADDWSAATARDADTLASRRATIIRLTVLIENSYELLLDVLLDGVVAS